MNVLGRRIAPRAKRDGSSFSSSSLSRHLQIRCSILVALILAIGLDHKTAFGLGIPAIVTHATPKLSVPNGRRYPTCTAMESIISSGRVRTSRNVQLWMELISFDEDDGDDDDKDGKPGAVSSTKTVAADAKKSSTAAERAALIQVGSVVSVKKSGLKAFNVPPQVCGSFNDDDDTFVPWSDEDVPVGKRYLTIPVGLQGEVVRVIDSNISARHPIQVKFDAGKQPSEKGFDLPAGFTFHFGADELEFIK